MLPVHWLANASNNLATIIEFIAERNAAAAAHLLDDIERATPSCHSIHTGIARGESQARGKSSCILTISWCTRSART